MLCRALEVTSWKPVRAAKFLMDHPKKNEVLEVPRKGRSQAGWRLTKVGGKSGKIHHEVLE